MTGQKTKEIHEVIFVYLKKKGYSHRDVYLSGHMTNECLNIEVENDKGTWGLNIWIETYGVEGDVKIIHVI